MSKSTLHRRQISWMGWLAALALLLTSCGGPDPQPSPDSSSAATVTQELGETVTSRTGENTGAPSETGETDGPTTESPVPPQTTVHTADPQPTKKPTPAPAGFLKPFQKEAGYRIVRGSSAEEKEAAAAVQEAVYKSAGIRLEVVTATQSQSAGQTEILIGNTGRPETKTAKNWLGKDSLIIAAVEQKLVILGGDPAGTLLAADVFVSEYVTGPDAAFPRDLQAVYGVEDTIAYGEYTNNSAVNANDPWVVRDGDGYYYCWSENGIVVSYCETLADIATARKRARNVWRPKDGTSWSQELWAPELHKIDGKWYIYVAADDGKNENHRMYVLRGTSDDPTKPFELVGQITDSTNKWAIDGTVLQYGGELYFVWSGWEGDRNVRQNIYIAHMKNPYTIDSQRVLLSIPTYAWEKQGNPDINEGPVAVVGDGVIHLIYSASACWLDDYCLGQLTWKGGDLLDPKSWEKSPQPVFSQVKGAYGPGHCSFAQALDGKLWMFYHANAQSGTGTDGRSLRMQPVEWNGSTLRLGQPAPLGQVLKYPYKTKKVTGRIR